MVNLKPVWPKAHTVIPTMFMLMIETSVVCKCFANSGLLFTWILEQERVLTVCLPANVDSVPALTHVVIRHATTIDWKRCHAE